jgi:hypothetical protein
MPAGQPIGKGIVVVRDTLGDVISMWLAWIIAW